MKKKRQTICFAAKRVPELPRIVINVKRPKYKKQIDDLIDYLAKELKIGGNKR